MAYFCRMEKAPSHIGMNQSRVRRGWVADTAVDVIRTLFLLRLFEELMLLLSIQNERCDIDFLMVVFSCLCCDLIEIRLTARREESNSSLGVFRLWSHKCYL